MNPVTAKLAIDLILLLLTRANEIGMKLKQAQDEGRELTAEELREARGQLDDEIAKLDAEIEKARSSD